MWLKSGDDTIMLGGRSRLRRTFGDAFDFVIVREIARGGMGTVYEALQCGVRGFSKRVALKVIRSDVSRSPELRELFVAEAHLVADLVHEGIVQIYHLGEVPAEGPGEPPLLYFSMELIDGVPLTAIIDRHRARGTPVPVEIAAFVASRVCRALEYAHGRTDAFGEPLGIVHRDVCPENILLARGGVVKLSDFGVAKARYRTSGGGFQGEEGQVLVGRARYMSPEAARFEATDARSDVFSIAVVLYEMLAGADAFRAAGGAASKGRVRSLLPLKLVNPEVPEPLDAIVTRALERDPARRWQAAGELGLELERFIYAKGYGPTNLTLAAHIREIFPDPLEPAQAPLPAPDPAGGTAA
ncbi:MAG TPA: serine/threonine-protein kinase [Planctomycetota bacterium]|nr:serine/threonine-protein kinase [Planctomycetota bacterium]